MIREKQSFNPEQARTVIEEIPGRSMLEKYRELAMLDKDRADNKNGNPSREIIHDPEDPEGRPLYEKRWDYHRRQNESGDWEDGLELKSVSERRLDYKNQRHPTKPTRETGQHLAREHAWINNYEYDEAGNCTRFYGEVTEGEKRGEKWKETKTYESIGEFTKITCVNISEQHDGQQKRTIKVEYHNAEGKSIYGQKIIIGQPETHHAWGKKPAELPDLKLEEL